MVTLKEKYLKEIRPAFMRARGITNLHRAPRIEKIVVNMGIGCETDKDVFKQLTNDLAAVTGQRPLVTRSRLSISNFKLREGMTVGAKVTLRGQQMYEFLDRLINAALPRIRDFRGVSAKGFDGRGNFTMGIQDQVIFPEIDPDRVKVVQGMNISIVTTAETDDEAKELLIMMGFPFATS
jgi:large subunit ribosomal protein L5